ncbi:SMP-30/gluconolactonase/LRE family protein [Streptomyces sp. NPDC096311]|uniref:SMP-30/gluconolactonase/LRE family protein n=1 Tax=Streptomyces sp. NPDC096311 TaxID=3366083 RepID=UPI0037FA61F7
MPRTSPVTSRRAVLGGMAAAALTVAAAGTASAGTGAAHNRTKGWPAEFPLPNGFFPESIAIGRKPYAYTGSLSTGAIYRADLRTGKGKVIYPGEVGTVALGMQLDHDGLLYYAAGGGTARVLDTSTGKLVNSFELAPAKGHMINDAILLGDRVWFTDWSDAALYGVPRGHRGRVRRLPLSGDWVQVPDVLNANGIVSAPDGRGVIVVSSQPGKLYHIDLSTGYATKITLKGADDVVNGDGLLRVGCRLYVVQNRKNLVSVFDLDMRARKATLCRTITDPRFDVPTAVARFDNRLYLVNARFNTAPTQDTTYNAVSVRL